MGYYYGKLQFICIMQIDIFIGSNKDSMEFEECMGYENIGYGMYINTYID